MCVTYVARHSHTIVGTVRAGSLTSMVRPDGGTTLRSSALDIGLIVMDELQAAGTSQPSRLLPEGLICMGQCSMLIRTAHKSEHGGL